MESVQLASQSQRGFKGGVDRVMIQLNTLQAPHYPETLDR